MSRGFTTFVSWGLVWALILLITAGPLASQASGRGQLVGFVFGRDGLTPVAGAVVVARNVTTGTTTQSSETDALGVFKVEHLESGVYALGVTSSEGSYNSQDLVGVKPGETSKISIALSPYDRDALEAAQTVAREEKERGESRVGKVIGYVPSTREAMIAIDRGLVQVGDRIRVRGGVTDFSQDVKALRVQGALSKYCVAGQQARLAVARACTAGDGVFVVCKRGVPPLFLAPLGLAAIVAGSASLVSIEEEETVSPTKPTKIKG